MKLINWLERTSLEWKISSGESAIERKPYLLCNSVRLRSEWVDRRLQALWMNTWFWVVWTHVVVSLSLLALVRLVAATMLVLCSWDSTSRKGAPIHIWVFLRAHHGGVLCRQRHVVRLVENQTLGCWCPCTIWGWVLACDVGLWLCEELRVWNVKCVWWLGIIVVCAITPHIQIGDGLLLRKGLVWLESWSGNKGRIVHILLVASCRVVDFAGVTLLDNMLSAVGEAHACHLWIGLVYVLQCQATNYMNNK